MAAPAEKQLKKDIELLVDTFLRKNFQLTREELLATRKEDMIIIKTIIANSAISLIRPSHNLKPIVFAAELLKCSRAEIYHLAYNKHQELLSKMCTDDQSTDWYWENYWDFHHDLAKLTYNDIKGVEEVRHSAVVAEEPDPSAIFTGELLWEAAMKNPIARIEKPRMCGPAVIQRTYLKINPSGTYGKELLSLRKDEWVRSNGLSKRPIGHIEYIVIRSEFVMNTKLIKNASILHQLTHGL